MKRIFTLMLLAAAVQACNDSKISTATTATVTTDTAPVVTPAIPAPVVDTVAINQANDSIFPGKSIGNVAINEKMEVVAKTLGPADDGDAAMGKAISIWRSKPKAGDTAIHTFTIYSTTNFGDKDEAPRVKIIRATSPFFKTAEGVGSGSTLAFIKMKYPAVKKPYAAYRDTLMNAQLMIYEATKDGIAFEINEAGKCVGVIVHKPGDYSVNTYLPMFPELKKL